MEGDVAAAAGSIWDSVESIGTTVWVALAVFAAAIIEPSQRTLVHRTFARQSVLCLLRFPLLDRGR